MRVSVGPYGDRVPEVNEFGQPVGDVVRAWRSRDRPARIGLIGRYAALQPVTTLHVPPLFLSLCGPDDGALWTYRTTPPPETEGALADLVDDWMDPAADSLTWAVIPTGGEAAGMTSFYRIEPEHGQVEVAAIVYARSLQRTPAATEATYLLMRYAFDGLGYRRFEWKCDALNEPSRQAALRLGFTYEGRFRNHLVTKGRNRDTDWFSVTDAEWPVLKQAFQTWLHPDNFDEAGKQRLALSEVRARVEG
jgi:RimJ/RimL family protein N-acetyltransferase